MKMSAADEARLSKAFGEILLTAGQLSKAPDTAEMRKHLYLIMERAMKASEAVREVEETTRSVAIRQLEEAR